ncbi:lysophospholipid acyltransferase family protein [Mycolicibacterium litorale]|uniref:1-acyl-sn-glycerol-3-phosphate acyltransferase n=1 Tax=Mycolicibacterium litorale TaxID=758802 RepID=A0AAD1INF6_9MYCO|nr:lysophospholipid acyltransferase family protein [Mycolicibacterium litorale]MCV7417738.1 1-acyl-sn-glycerol-3-phosphate acyltransferase [Mycolicibacterium litorale]TDY06872.1 1-acyl-sn-glycerol-3-phosphate acyltransferase [Mycolicibacterium litorale]BBY18970.1 1-acyl-sn-glycerol-3-phosphate acyltransferase [Mycolicibacterium litorale]
MEPVFRTLEIVAEAVARINGTRITYHGLEHIPARGGAVVAINHTSYVDWLPAALAVKQRRRRMRFMIKAEMERVRIVGFLIRHTGTIPVDRRAGAGAYAAAVQSLRAGELVGVYPEATISRSFELKEFKTGAARMAIEAGVPIVPLIVWGAQRVWTKDHPRAVGRSRIPITVVVGEPIAAAEPVSELSVTLREAMGALLDRAQSDYPHPAGEYWVPRRLGGGAPTIEEARRLDEAELAERARRRAEGGRPT